MILYRVEFNAVRPGVGLSSVTKVQWFGTERDMVKFKTATKKAGGKIITAEKTEVPVDKAGLLAWLNECCGVCQ